MLRVDRASAPPPPLLAESFVDPEVMYARAYIAACRACGLVLVPWRAGRRDNNRGMVLITGQEIDGPNDFSAGTDRLLKHPDGLANRECRKGLIFEMLCEDFGLSSDDPALCDKINARFRAKADRVAP